MKPYSLLLLPDDCSAVKYSYSFLVEGKEDEAISLLSPPKDSDSGEAHSEKSNRWWVDIRIKLKLCNIYWNRGTLGDFVEIIFPLIRESLYVATLRQKIVNIFWMRLAIPQPKTTTKYVRSCNSWIKNNY
ncbi:unnamed protein product [Sphenostylis stenocarpa]|uniref:Uncharacterized protein n=1 Tax=Sphenostylis stenocarpa TaxID=92480 RepID=A0AA86S5A4_9FABA|nr:unnamed protein product [Sphenostylis stenocarpa]